MMKSYAAILASCLLLSGAAFAQNNSNSTASNVSSAKNLQNLNNEKQQNEQKQDMESQSSQNSQNSQSSQSANSMSNGQQQSLEGCVVRRETDYYIQPDNGTAVRLRGSQDMSRAENHRAHVTGSYGNGENATAGANNNMNSSSSSASNNSSTSNNNMNSGNSSAASGSAGMGNNNNAKDFFVTQVDSVSEACPNTNGNTPR